MVVDIQITNGNDIKFQDEEDETQEKESEDQNSLDEEDGGV